MAVNTQPVLEQLRKYENIIPILDGYDELGELIELAIRLKRKTGQLQWYIEHVEQRIAKIMKPARIG